jgi:predicted nuclease with RNAse H fold
MTSHKTTIGIDVGGVKKGFHAVANRNGLYLEKFHSIHPDEISAWALSHNPSAVAIDAPSMFSLKSGSRKAERDLVSNGMRCFYTPTRALAAKSRFYDWVFNGELLYQKLELPIFMGEQSQEPCVIETFPHAVQMSLWAGESNPVGNKRSVRESTLALKANYDTSQLSNIDFIDAALCAVSADYFAHHQYIAYGCKTEGYIILPKSPSNKP